MKKRLFLLPLFSILAACNGGLGDKSRTLARIDIQAFTEEDLDLRLSTQSDEQREAILNDAEARRSNFENILRSRLFALAGQKDAPGNRDSLNHRLALADQRVVTQYYFDTYLNQYGGHTRKEIEAYYNANTSKFAGDSGKILPLTRVLDRAADSLLISTANLDSFYLAGKSNYINKLNCDSLTTLAHPDSCKAEILPPLADRRPQVASDFVHAYKAKRSETAAADLKAKYGVRLVSPTKSPSEDEIRNYYEQNKENYESPETFELYDIEMAKKEKLLPRYKQVKDLDGFKSLASQTTENPLLKAQGGYVGIVKRDFCLPYGIGMLPELFPGLDAVQSGKVDPIQSSDTHKWHFFWLVKKEPRKAKPLDRVHSLVKSDLLANRISNIKAGDTLAVYGDGRVLRESDVLFLKEEIPPEMRERYTRESLVDYLITWQVASDEAKALGLTEEKRLIALRLQNEDGFWGRIYQESIMPRSYEEDTVMLAKTFSEKSGIFTKDTTDRDWHKYVHDIAAYLTLTPQDFNIEYYTNPEHYQHDTIMPAMSSVMFEVFQNVKAAGYQRLDKRMMDHLKGRFNVRVVDPTLEEPSLEPAAESYKRAQSLHYDRKLDQALALYGKLREAFPDRAALQDSICFGIAQIYIEQERYQQALAEYRRISYLYPSSANNYKAMFMVGFIYSEHLKNDSTAVRSFEKMLAKYPNTDLSDDADWMIRNIRSGGKLMPKLEGDSSSVAPDSAATKSRK